jgi:hypothetical protein
VDLRGLKKRFLGKHRIFVDRFYKRLSDEFGTSQTARKITERLQKNRNTMFTFLDFDDVPWNNNNAEHAIKAFASLRRVFEGTTTEKGLREFLVLLSLCETCKYRNVDFLDFLRSGERTRVRGHPPAVKPGYHGTPFDGCKTKQIRATLCLHRVSPWP